MEPSHPLTDHNYYNPLISPPENRSSHVSLLEDLNLQCDNDSIDSECSSTYNDENYAQSNNIETETVCAEFTELVITDVQDSYIPTYHTGTNTSGTNAVADISIVIQSDTADTSIMYNMHKDVNITDNLCTVKGTNDHDHCNKECTPGINISNVKGLNNTEFDISENVMDRSMHSYAIQGINSDNSGSESSNFEGFTSSDLKNISISDKDIMGINSDNSSSESSEFEGFTSGNLKSAIMSEAGITVDASIMMTSDSYEYDDIEEDSSDTIPAIEHTSTLVNSSQMLHDMSPVMNNAQHISADVRNIWENDVRRKKWMIPLRKLTPMDIYTLSKPAPNWEAMDPYSGLSKYHESAEDTDPVPSAHSNATNKSEQVKGSNLKRNKLCRSKRNDKRIRYLEEYMSDENDSDYDPHPKPVKKPIAGLKAPSSARIHAQNIIRSAKEKSEAGRRLLLLDSNDEERNCKCPYCNNTFFFTDSVCVHIDQAHQDIVNVKGITDNSGDAKPSGNVTKGTNNPEVTESVPIQNVVQGTNNPNVTENPPSQNIIQKEDTVMSIGDPKRINSYHKHRPKPRGLHNRPTRPKSPAAVDVSQKKELKSEFITVTHGLKKQRKQCCFKCNICHCICTSQALANKHYKSNHPPVSCPECRMVFTNPISLCCHKYKHQPLNFPC